MEMKICLGCLRHSIEYDPNQKTERCIWKDCRWTNIEKIDLNKANEIIFILKESFELKRKSDGKIM